jgi:hypothetical protein
VIIKYIFSVTGFMDALSNGKPLPYNKVELVQLTSSAGIGM